MTTPGRRQAGRRSWPSTPLAVFAVVLLAAVPLVAQTQFASFTGAITSKDGNPVPNVDVVATNVATMVKYTAKSNNNGLYTISALPIGTYKVRAEAQSFQAYETNPIRLESGQIARLDIPLQLGVSENVEVMGVSPILQTQDAVVGEVISEGTIKNMPLNGRNFSQLSLLLPGVVTTDPNSFTEPKNFGSGRPNVNGQREQANNYMLDGVDMNEVDRQPRCPTSRTPTPWPKSGSTRTTTRPSSATCPAAVIGSTIKSGTNEFHGTALRVLARQQPDRELLGRTTAPGRRRPSCRSTSSARTLGGPIIKNKLFFFGDYQGFIRDRPGELVTSVAPEAYRRGDFSGSASRSSTRDRPAVPREPDPAEPLQPDRAGDPLRPDPLSATQPGRRPEQLRHGLLGQAPDAPGRLQAGLQRLGQGPHVRARVVPALHVGAGAGAAAEPAGRHEHLALLRRGPELDAHRERERRQRAAAGLHAGEVPDRHQRLGRHRGRQRDDRHPRRAGDRRPERVQHRQLRARQRRHPGVQRHQDLPAHGEVLALQGTPLLQVRRALALPAAGLLVLGQRGDPRPLQLHGAFTGFAFADFLLDDVAQKGKGGDTRPLHPAPEPHRHLRAGRLPGPDEPHGQPRDLLGVHLALVEKDDRQINIDLATGQILQAGRDGASRALYDAYYGGFEPRVGFAWTPTEKWAVRGAFGIVQYMEGTGKNLRLPANPPYFVEGQGNFDATTGARHGRRSGSRTSSPPRADRARSTGVREGPAAADDEAVERVRGAEGDRRALGPGRVRRQPLHPHGRPVRLQPAEPRSSGPLDLGTPPGAAAALSV